MCVSVKGKCECEGEANLPVVLCFVEAPSVLSEDVRRHWSPRAVLQCQRQGPPYAEHPVPSLQCKIQYYVACPL